MQIKKYGLPDMNLFDSFPKEIRDWINTAVPDANLEDVQKSLTQNGPAKTLNLLRSWETSHILKNLDAEKIARGW